jgi:hypothetical protein
MKTMVMIYPNRKDIPEELLKIQSEWKERAEKYGDIGGCVLGAGFKFTYKGVEYFMPPVSKWQGSLSWEHCKDEIKSMLSDIGATNIEYNWGILD